MIIPVAEARELMGKAAKQYTDQQLEEVINIFDFLADMSIDCYLLKRKERLENNKTNEDKNLSPNNFDVSTDISKNKAKERDI